MTNDHDIWQWQEPGTAWKGAGLYHITLKIPSHEALLGTLVIPNDDPKQARVDILPLGKAVLDCLRKVPEYHPEIQVLHYCLMPDHLHSVWYVRHQMPQGILSAIRGFWQGAKKAGREIFPPAPHALSSDAPQALSSVTSDSIRPEFKERIFTEMPHIRPMGQYRQLSATNQYIDMNPQRLATKRKNPKFFRVQEGIEIAGRTFRAVGNADILQHFRYAPVHVHSEWVKMAINGNDKPLRDYMNGCVKDARQGTVMVSPFISDKEKEVLVVLLAEGHNIILLTDNGFRDYYKPSDGLFDSVEAGHVLILSPFDYNPKKHRISRDECVALNNMAAEIASSLSSSPAPHGLSSVTSDTIRQNPPADEK